MERFLSNEQMRQADAYTINELGVPSGELMRRAGYAIAEEVERALEQTGEKKVLVVCGCGNNGGDGYVCAQKLISDGFDVKVYALNGRLSPDCERERQNYSGEYSNEICGDVIVDCIFGTGLSRTVSGEAAQVIERINSSGAFVVSADIPSGINGDNGRIEGVAINADLTVAVAEYKLGMVLGDGVDYCGAVVKRDIGITANGNYAEAYADEDICRFFPARRRNSHKGTYGSANLIVGSARYKGAAALALSAALQSGCGYVKLTAESVVSDALVTAYPQAIYMQSCDLSSQAIAVGSGCGVSEDLYSQIVGILTSYEGKLIIDADGLNSLAKYGVDALKRKKCQVLITPHVKEFSRLTKLSVEEILHNPTDCARNFAKEYGVTVLLKGAATIICDEEKTALNLRGTTALSKGGSGDLLTGLICGSAARGLNVFDAAVAASYVLGSAAEDCSREKTDYCVTAKDLIKNFHKVVKRLTNG
ncbi:MAG: NAD(P)H-hydrate dehydratase [Candidatus Coproplasma sp.]